MKVAMSQYLRTVKPVLKQLVNLLLKRFQYASILGTDVTGTTYSVRKRTMSINTNSFAERGFVARVYADKRYYEYSFSAINSQNVEQIANEITNTFEKAAKISPNIIDYKLIKEEETTQSFCGEVEVLLDGIKVEDIMAKLKAITDKAWDYSGNLIDAIAALNNCHVSKVFVSQKKDLEQSYIWSEAYMFVIARKGDVAKDSYKGFSGLKGLEILDEMEGSIQEVVKTAEELLDAGNITPGVYDVVFGPSSAGMIAHEAFGHGVEMDMFVKDRAQGANFIGKDVASKKVTMRDGAKSFAHVSSYLFDDEGTLGTDTVVIENGILKSGISDLLSALKLGTTPTGNGKRESFERKAYTRMTNTFFAEGSDSYEDMIASIKYGFLIEDASSGMEDPKDWGIQVMFSYAREIVDGKLSGKVFAPIIMTGHVVELLKSITMVSPNVKVEGSGACGKGYKEYVKVSTGGPYIKAKARLG